MLKILINIDDYYNGIYLSIFINMVSIISGAVLLVSSKIMYKGTILVKE